MSRIVYGINPVREALVANPDDVEKVCYSSRDKPPIKDILAICRKSGVKTFQDQKEKLDKLSECDSHQGVIAVIADFKYCHIEDILDAWRASSEKAFILVLDGIQDPHNLGAIIRTAESAALHGVIIPSDRAASVTSTVEKVSAGAVEHLKIAKVTNISRAIDVLKASGVWVAGAEAAEGLSLYDADLDVDLALVVGSEGKGMRPLVKQKCDFIFSIPMKGMVNSLNVSVSAAISIYETLRQRRSGLK